MRTTAHRNSGSFDEGHGEILVAVLCVAFTFLLAFGDPLALDASVVGTELPNAGKRAMLPVSSMMVVARVSPMHGAASTG